MPEDRKPVIWHAPSYVSHVVPAISPRVRRLGEALNPRKRFERAMLEGRVPVTRSGLRYAQGSSLMDRKTDPSPKRSIWDAPFGAPTEGLTPAQTLWLSANAATLPVTGTLGLVGLAALFGSGYFPDLPAGERVDPETGETIPATKIRDMFKKEHRIPSVRQHWKEGQKGIAALQAAGVALPAALAAYTRGGIGGLRGTGSKAVADEVDEMRRTVLKGGVVAGGLAAVGPKLWSTLRGATKIIPEAASKFKRMDFGGFTDTLNKLGVPSNVFDARGLQGGLSTNRGFVFQGAQGPSLRHSIRNRMRRLAPSGEGWERTPVSEIAPTLQIHQSRLAERIAAELKALNLERNYGIQARNMVKVEGVEGLSVGGRSRFENLGTFKPAHTSGEGIGQLKVFEINGVPVVQDVKGALFIPNGQGILQLKNFELTQFASRMGYRPTQVRNAKRIGDWLRHPSGPQGFEMDYLLQTGGLGPREKEIFRAWQNVPVAGRGDTGGSLVKIGEYRNPWTENFPAVVSHNLEGVPVHRVGDQFSLSSWGTGGGSGPWTPRWDYLAKPK